MRSISNSPITFCRGKEAYTTGVIQNYAPGVYLRPLLLFPFGHDERSLPGACRRAVRRVAKHRSGAGFLHAGGEIRPVVDEAGAFGAGADPGAGAGQ